jgi:hypothetical protein
MQVQIGSTTSRLGSSTWFLYNLHMRGVQGLCPTVVLDSIVMDDVHRVPHLFWTLFYFPGTTPVDDYAQREDS